MGQKTALGSLLKAIGNSGQGKVVPLGSCTCDDYNRRLSFSLPSYSSSDLQPIITSSRIFCRLEWQLNKDKQLITIYPLI